MVKNASVKNFSLVIAEVGLEPISKGPIFEEIQSQFANDGPFRWVS
jgi:hypothetical protein